MFKTIKSRASGFNPKNRFEELYIDYTDVNFSDIEDSEIERTVQTAYFRDTTRSILAKNDSPDLGFTYSINPYRGCEHGCIYCYARPTHEYLGFSAGLDFETKIMVKLDAAELLKEAFMKKSWQPQVIVFSGNTDCYQPAERKLQLTRKCLEVFLKFGNPVGLITKNALVQRDIDILRELAQLNLVKVTLSITTLNRELSRKLEPRTSVPSERLRTIEVMAKNNIPVGVNVAPVIPGLNDEEIPAILRETSQSGAKHAGMIILRLPYSVKDLFTDWIIRNIPEKSSKILNRIRDVRGGSLSDPRFGSRLTGEGEIAESIHKLFEVSCKKHGLNKNVGKLTTELFRRVNNEEPDEIDVQTKLF